ncbi:MAG: hypothetical protein MI924_34795, partial [Chloroflexales bacterium]|nr:hypothetical protein [Chloroflexales bacterium]
MFRSKIMPRVYRKLFSFLSLCALLTACGNAPVASVEVDAPIATKATGIATSNQVDSLDCAVGLRLFDHEYLAGDPVCIPEHPQRVAPLDLNSIEFM